MRITVVGTVHEENGLANVMELLEVLRRLQPDVIFAEIPAAHVDGYLDGPDGNLESTAVRGYRENRQVTVVPVDLEKPEDEFFSRAKMLFDAVERTSLTYRRMVDRNTRDTRVGGFPYLNSSRCIQAWADIYGEVLATVDWIGDPRLREIYDLWAHTNELREQVMVRNATNYCARHEVARGLFLIGAAHSKSILDKAESGLRAGVRRIQWGVLDGPV
jgi:hypothetical protein